MDCDVAIVGAGIGGAVLGLALGRRGWRVVLVEREPAPPRLARPEILWGATLSALDTLGVGDEIRREACVVLEGIDVSRPSGRLLSIGRGDFAAAGTSGFSTDPSLTRSMLVDAALATDSVEVHRGVEVTGIHRDEGRASGVSGRKGTQAFALGARLIVGDDGTHSVVRTQLGIPLALTPFPIDFISASIRWPDSLPPARGQVRVNPPAFRAGLPAVLLLPWPRGEGVMLVPLVHERAERLFASGGDSFWSDLQQLTPIASVLREQLEFPRDFRRVRRPFGHAEHYVADGAAILGDAAHPMTPAGGQGANAAVWDALALAEVADAALRAGDPMHERLVEYERLRHPVNARSVAISRNAARLFRTARHLLPLSILLPPGARLVECLAWPKRKLVRNFASAFVTR